MPSDAVYPLDNSLRDVPGRAADSPRAEEWNTCERLSDGYTPGDLRDRRADLLFGALLNGHEGLADALAGRIPIDELLPLFDHLGPAAKEAMMTTAEMLRAEGEARGRLRERAEVLIQLLTVKFGKVSASVEQSVREADADQLGGWITRVLVAESVEDVLA